MEEIKDKRIDDLTIEEIVKFCNQKFGLKEMLDQMDDDDILDAIDNNEILEYLDGTYALASHDDDIQTESYNEGWSDCYDELHQNKTEFLDSIKEYSVDELHMFVCDLIETTYSDQFNIDCEFKRLIERLNKNSFGIHYEH